MFAYCFLLAVPLLLALILYGIKRTYRLNQMPYQEKIIEVFFVIFFFMLAFRGSTVGADTWNYLAKFRAARSSSWLEFLDTSTSETGFALLTKLISEFTGSEQIYLTVIALITVLPIARLYTQESESPILTISLYVILPMFSMLFSGLRQAIAMAFVPLAYQYVKDRRLLRFLITVWIASMFHRSAWLLLALYPVYHMKISRKSLLWVIPLLLGIYVFNDQIYTLATRLLSRLLAEEFSETGATGAYSMLILFSMILIFSYVFLGDADEETIGQRNILVLSVGLQCFALVNTIAMRMNYYFLLFLPLLLPKVIKRISNRNKWFGYAVQFVCCAYFIYYYLEKAYSGESGVSIYPYIPFWAA